MRFTPTKKTNPCVICGDTGSRCRHTDNFLLCMSSVDGDIDATPIGYKFRRSTKDGLWGIYSEHKEGDRISKEEWLASQELYRKQMLLNEMQHLSVQMSCVDRNRYYRKMLGCLTLDSRDRDNLRDRGLTDNQIDAGLFRSVDQWQRLDTEFPTNLPGVNIDGLSLNTQSGYLCPIIDADNLITGCQVRMHDAVGGRYRWLSSNTKIRPNGASPHLRSGDIPINFVIPDEPANTAHLGLCEGILKSYVAANKTGSIFIGASGGSFALSPQQLKTCFYTAVGMGIRRAVFYPDAGSIANKGVMGRYQMTFSLLQEWGISLRIAWWNQVTKGQDKDIDELDDYSQIQYISVKDFLSLSTK